MSTAEEIGQRYREVRDRIDGAAQPGQTVRLIAVSKRFDAAIAAAGYRAGCHDLGENYAQELEAKATAVPDLLENSSDLRWHMIGPVQRNKVRKIGPAVHLWHTVDRESLVDEIAKRSPGARILLQVNLTGEDSKSGCTESVLAPLLTHAGMRGLDVQGLMTMGPTSAAEDPRPIFARCRALADLHQLVHCSMGMSGDFEQAILEGATMVRVGSALFGPRP